MKKKLITVLVIAAVALGLGLAGFSVSQNLADPPMGGMPPIG
jgi:hypothetical protein